MEGLRLMSAATPSQSSTLQPMSTRKAETALPNTMSTSLPNSISTSLPNTISTSLPGTSHNLQSKVVSGVIARGSQGPVAQSPPASSPLLVEQATLKVGQVAVGSAREMLQASEAAAPVEEDTVWSADRSSCLCEVGEEDLFRALVPLLRLPGVRGVSDAIGMLNERPVSNCPDGICVVLSESQGHYYLLYRTDKKKEAERVTSFVAQAQVKARAKQSPFSAQASKQATAEVSQALKELLAKQSGGVEVSRALSPEPVGRMAKVIAAPDDAAQAPFGTEASLRLDYSSTQAVVIAAESHTRKVSLTPVGRAVSDEVTTKASLMTDSLSRSANSATVPTHGASGAKATVVSDVARTKAETTLRESVLALRTKLDALSVPRPDPVSPFGAEMLVEEEKPKEPSPLSSQEDIPFSQLPARISEIERELEKTQAAMDSIEQRATTPTSGMQTLSHSTTSEDENSKAGMASIEQRMTSQTSVTSAMATTYGVVGTVASALAAIVQTVSPSTPTEDEKAKAAMDSVPVRMVTPHTAENEITKAAIERVELRLTSMGRSTETAQASPESPKSSSQPKFNVGDHVQFKHEDSWEDGVVTSANPLLVRYLILPDMEGLEYAEVRKHPPRVAAQDDSPTKVALTQSTLEALQKSLNSKAMAMSDSPQVSRLPLGSSVPPLKDEKPTNSKDSAVYTVSKKREKGEKWGVGFDTTMLDVRLTIQVICEDGLFSPSKQEYKEHCLYVGDEIIQVNNKVKAREMFDEFKQADTLFLKVRPMVSPGDFRQWLDAAQDFELNEDFDISESLPQVPIGFQTLMGIMKSESAGKATIQALGDKLLLSQLLDNLEVPQMPVLFTTRRDAHDAEVKDFVNGLFLKDLDGDSHAFDIVVKPTHLSNASGALVLSKEKWRLGALSAERLVEHMKKYLGKHAADEESEALKSLIPGFVVQPRYQSVIEFKAPLEMRVITLWGKARLGIWWWGRKVEGEDPAPGQKPQRTAWVVRKAGVEGFSNNEDSWEVLHCHDGSNKGFEKSLEIFLQAMPAMAAAAEVVAQAVGAPFLRSDFFAGSEKWGIRLNEVAYGSGVDCRCRMPGSEETADDSIFIARVLQEGMKLCKRRPANTFLGALGATGSTYESMAVFSVLDNSLNRPRLPSSAFRAFDSAASKNAAVNSCTQYECETNASDSKRNSLTVPLENKPLQAAKVISTPSQRCPPAMETLLNASPSSRAGTTRKATTRYGLPMGMGRSLQAPVGGGTATTAPPAQPGKCYQIGRSSPHLVNRPQMPSHTAQNSYVPTGAAAVRSPSAAAVRTTSAAPVGGVFASRAKVLQ